MTTQDSKYTVTVGGVTVPFNWSTDLAAVRRSIALATSECWRQLAVATGPAADKALTDAITIGGTTSKLDTPGALIKAAHAAGGAPLLSPRA